MEEIRAVVGDQNMMAAFWVVVGALVLSNVGLVVTGVFSGYRQWLKMRADLNEAFKRIRALEKNQQEEP